MKSENASYKIILPMSIENMLKHIERCGRLCYKSEGSATEDSWKRWAMDKVKIGHLSVLEHTGFTVIFTNDRGITHEEVRQRLASFSQESTRYCNYSGDKFGNQITFIGIDRGIGLDDTMMRKYKSGEISESDIDAILAEWEHAMLDAEKHYMKMTELGATPQIARSVLPNSTKADIAITANNREWMDVILPSRTSDKAHPQMREVMIPVLLDMQMICPQLYGHIPVSDVPAWYKFDESRIMVIGDDGEL